MKKSIFLLICMLTLNTDFVSAQKGGILIYGNMQGYSHRQEYSGSVQKTKLFTIAPGVGYGIHKNFIVGLNLFYLAKKETNTFQSIDTKIQAFGIGPFARYTRPIAGIFDFRLQLNVNYQYSKNEQPAVVNPVVDKGVSSGIDLKLMPSVGIHIGKHWMLDAGYGYLDFSSYTSHSDNGDPGDDEKVIDDKFELVINPTSFYWGVSYTFGGATTE